MSMSLFWPGGRASKPSSSLHDGEANASITAVGTAENALGTTTGGTKQELKADSSKQRPAMRERQDTAHDRALKDLHSRHGGSAGGGTVDSGTNASGSDPHAHAATTPSSAFPHGPEEFYDPASGALAGYLKSPPPPPPNDSDDPNAASHDDDEDNSPHALTTPTDRDRLGGPGTSHEDMWNQLSKIRVLQSEIARMHLALDKPGIVESSSSGGMNNNSGDHSSRRRGTGPETLPGRIDTGVTGASASRNGTGESDPPHAIPEDEFARRKESIGTIMSKLDALSVAVTEFHTLPAPPLDFPSPSSAISSRANSLQPFGSATTQKHERKMFSEPSMMSTFSNRSVTAIPGAAVSQSRRDSQDSLASPPPPPPPLFRTSTMKSTGSGGGGGGGDGRNSLPPPVIASHAASKDYFYTTNRPSSSPQHTMHSFTSHVGELPSSSSSTTAAATPGTNRRVGSGANSGNINAGAAAAGASGGAAAAPSPLPPLLGRRIVTGTRPSPLAISTTAPPPTPPYKGTSSSSDARPASSSDLLLRASSTSPDNRDDDNNDSHANRPPLQHVGGRDEDDEHEHEGEYESTPLIRSNNKSLQDLQHSSSSSSDSQTRSRTQSLTRPPPPLPISLSSSSPSAARATPDTDKYNDDNFGLQQELSSRWTSGYQHTNHKRLSTLYEPTTTGTSTTNGTNSNAGTERGGGSSPPSLSASAHLHLPSDGGTLLKAPSIKIEDAMMDSDDAASGFGVTGAGQQYHESPPGTPNSLSTS